MNFKLIFITMIPMIPSPIILIYLVYLVMIIGVFVMIYKWVTKFISLKQEQNDLLKEYIQKIDKK